MWWTSTAQSSAKPVARLLSTVAAIGVFLSIGCSKSDPQPVQIPLRPSPALAQVPIERICDHVEAPATREVCEATLYPCVEREGEDRRDKEPNIRRCLAEKLAKFDLGVSRLICRSAPTIEEAKGCFGFILATYDKEVALSQCERIRDQDARIYCKVDVLKGFNNFEALDTCDGYTRRDKQLQCKAFIAGQEMFDRDRALEYCREIADRRSSEHCAREIDEAYRARR